MIASSLVVILSLVASPVLGLPNVQCDANTACEVGCCSEYGYCGFSPEFCGKGCQNNCDAAAQCGEYAPVETSECPEGTCCSEFGFCGAGEEFCGK